jgi:putative photosynthetic complex assembly protein 2
LAKLNVFLGVANPGAELLPAYLAPLRAYFGPARNSPLLAPSAAVLAAAAVWALAGARAGRVPARRTGLALLAGVLALAAFEHAVLGARVPLAWWDAFLRWRGAA